MASRMAAGVVDEAVGRIIGDDLSVDLDCLQRRIGWRRCHPSQSRLRRCWQSVSLRMQARERDRRAILQAASRRGDLRLAAGAIWPAAALIWTQGRFAMAGSL
jgi:hypothetical protein